MVDTKKEQVFHNTSKITWILIMNMSRTLGVAVVRFLTLGIWRRWQLRARAARAAWPVNINIRSRVESAEGRDQGRVTSRAVMRRANIIGWMFSELIKFMLLACGMTSGHPGQCQMSDAAPGAPMMCCHLQCCRADHAHPVPSVVIWATPVQALHNGSIAIFIRAEYCINCPSSLQKKITRR